MTDQKKYTVEDVRAWLSSGKFKLDYQEDLSGVHAEPGLATGRFTFYTEKNKYYVRFREGEHDSYLGCVADSRKPRAGENWTRGNDLSDGPLTPATWTKILIDIISYEAVDIRK